VVFLAAALLAATASASEDEAWWGRALVPVSSVPLLALLVDTSEAMNARLDVLPPYEPDRDYTAEGAPACRRDRVYWRLGAGPPPDCGDAQWVSAESASPAHGWQCEAGRAALESVGVFIAARAAQWKPRGAGGYWGALAPGQGGAVECLADRGQHGAVPGPWFAADGEGGPWRDRADREPDWQAPPLSGAYLFYTGNYLAYLDSTDRIESTRYDWLVRRIGEAARAVSGLDVAVARFSHDGLGGDDDARGGMLALAPTPMPDGASAVSGLLRSWTPAGPAPIGETLVELTRWLSGEAVLFGEASQLEPGAPFPSVAGTRSVQDPGTYRTPFEHACRPAFTAIASAGEPASDAGAGDAFREVRALDAAGCQDDCIARITEALASGDLLPSLPGRQRTPVRWLLPQTADPAVTDAARAARRQPLDLDDPGALLAVMLEAVQNDAAEPAGPRVSAAGLESRAHPGPDSAVYLAFSRPDAVRAWPGNLRRYRLAPASGPVGAAQVLGRDGEPAFDGTGRLHSGSWSEWSPAPDGADLTLGGAAAALPDWTERLVFSDLAEAPLLDPQNRLTPGNPLLTRERLGLAPGDTRAPAILVEWLLGRDAFDEDFDDDRDESRRRLGDAGLRAPRVLRYAPDGPALAFLATEDGFLHAFDADTGVEQWAFAPAALLPQAAARSRQELRFDRLHGLDGPVELLLSDGGHDGRIEASEGDQAWLFVGLGRGGTGYYGLDVSDPAAPRLLWRLDAADLPGFGQSWPAPVAATMRLDPETQGDDPRVLVLSGGHDPAEDAAVTPASSLGAALAVVTAQTGAVLWRAGGIRDPLADLEVPSLHRSLPAAPRVLDTDGDGLDDRAYVVDAAGQLLRFDFATGGGAGVAARRVAHLGVPAGDGTARRFRVTPDAVPERREGQDVIALAFGSGWTSRPRSSGTVDRFYVVFDPLHAAAAPPALDESMLADVTGPDAVLPAGAPGWMYRLAGHGDGEKVTGQSLTFDHRVRFTTYQPLPPPADAPCGPPAGTARLYTLDIRDGSPVNRVGDRPVPDEEIDLEGLAPALAVSFPPAPGVQGCGTWTCRGVPTGWLGGRALPLGYRNDPVKTSWRQLDAQAE
jgi:type IV pilus assembly protein PilY1